MGRFVLSWVRDPAAVLRACAARLRPGGLVVVQEHDVHEPRWYHAFPTGEAARAHDAWSPRVLAAQGVRLDTAYRLYGAYLAAGLPGPQMRYEAPIGGGPDWPGYEARADHARRLAPLIIAAGLATAAELDTETLAERLRAEVTGQRGVLRCIPAIGLWARRP